MAQTSRTSILKLNHKFFYIKFTDDKNMNVIWIVRLSLIFSLRIKLNDISIKKFFGGLSKWQRSKTIP